MYENKTIFKILNFWYNQIFREQTQSLAWPHQSQFLLFFSWCAPSMGIYPLNAERIRMSCGTCTMREVTEFIIPVACQSSCSLTVGCHTAHISHRCRMLMGDPLFLALFLFFCLHNTFPLGEKKTKTPQKNQPKTSAASKLYFSCIHSIKLC